MIFLTVQDWISQRTQNLVTNHVKRRSALLIVYVMLMPLISVLAEQQHLDVLWESLNGL